MILTQYYELFLEKRCQKQFHAAHIKTKEFKQGDVVLVYIVKQH